MAYCLPACSKGATSSSSISFTWLNSPRQLSQHEVVGVPGLADQRGDNFAESIPQATIGAREARFHSIVQSRKSVERHHRKHVMFDVVVHVEVEKTKNWIELDRAC